MGVWLSRTAYTLDWRIVERLRLKPADGSLLPNGINAEFDCPQCHRPKKFHINIARNHAKFRFFQCLSAECGYKGRVRSSKDNDLDLTFLRYAEEQQKEDEERARKLEQDFAARTKMRLPRGFTPVLPRMNAWRYLIDRGITPADIRHYGLGIADGRVVFPDYDKNGELVYFVARDYTGAQFPKYTNPPLRLGEIGRSAHVFNMGRFQHAGYTTADIVEGPITGIIAGRRHLALLGKPSRGQVELIRSLKLKRAYLALDPDARPVCMQLAHDLWGAVGEIYLVPIPADHDVADIGREEYRRLKREEAILYDRNQHVPISVQFVLDGPLAKPRRLNAPRRGPRPHSLEEMERNQMERERKQTA